MQVVDQLTEIFYNHPDQGQRARATEELKYLNNFESVSQSLEILKETTSQFTINYCAANVTKLFTENYTLLRDVMSESAGQIFARLDELASKN